MQYEHFVEDFTERTLKNLRLVRKVKRGTKNRYEITQLVNSLLGLIVIPHEHLKGDIPPHKLVKLKERGWCLFDVEKDTTGCDNLRLLIENLRNGIAHGKLEFHGNKDIAAITITNDWEKKLWKGRISVGDLRRFVEKFAEEVIRVCKQKR